MSMTKAKAIHLTVRGELVEPPATQLEPFDKAFSPERRSFLRQAQDERGRRIRTNGTYK